MTTRKHALLALTPLILDGALPASAQPAANPVHPAAIRAAPLLVK